MHHPAGDGGGRKDGGVIYSTLPYPYKSWADYLRISIYSLPGDPAMDAVYRDKYDQQNGLRYRPLYPNEPDVFVARYKLFGPAREKNPQYGNYSFRFCDKKTGRRQLVPFARFGEFGFDQFAGTCDRAKVYAFEPNREKIDHAMREASRLFYHTLFEIDRQWSLYRPRLIIPEYDRRQRYRRYLSSPQWAAIRKRVCDKYRNACQECFRVGKIEVHHKTYERIGEERIEDLIALCPKCHKALHAGDIVLRVDVDQEVAA